MLCLQAGQRVKQQARKLILTSGPPALAAGEGLDERELVWEDLAVATAHLCPTDAKMQRTSERACASTASSASAVLPAPRAPVTSCACPRPSGVSASTACPRPCSPVRFYIDL